MYMFDYFVDFVYYRILLLADGCDVARVECSAGLQRRGLLWYSADEEIPDLLGIPQRLWFYSACGGRVVGDSPNDCGIVVKR